MAYNQAQNKATQKYIKNNLEEIKFRVPKGRKTFYKEAASNAGQSMASFIVTAMDEKIERDNLLPPDKAMKRDNSVTTSAALQESPKLDTPNPSINNTTSRQQELLSQLSALKAANDAEANKPADKPEPPFSEGLDEKLKRLQAEHSGNLKE